MIDGEGRAKLIDMGMASRFIVDDDHIQYTPNSVNAHRGTASFISEDAHRGALPSRRSDLENMGWVIIQLFVMLNKPKESWIHLKNKHDIMLFKVSVKKNLQTSLKKLLHGHSPSRVYDFFSYVNTLSYTDEPDYIRLQDIWV